MDCLAENWICFRFEDASAGFPRGASGDVLANGLRVLHPCWNMVMVEMGFVRCLGSYVNMYAMVFIFLKLTSCRRWWSIWWFWKKTSERWSTLLSFFVHKFRSTPRFPEKRKQKNAARSPFCQSGIYIQILELRYVSHCHADASSITSIFRYLSGGGECGWISLQCSRDSKWNGKGNRDVKGR